MLLSFEFQRRRGKSEGLRQDEYNLVDLGSILSPATAVIEHR